MGEWNQPVYKTDTFITRLIAICAFVSINKSNNTKCYQCGIAVTHILKYWMWHLYKWFITVQGLVPTDDLVQSSPALYIVALYNSETSFAIENEQWGKYEPIHLLQ